MIWFLIGYMFLFIHRPFEVWPTLGEHRIELVYVLLTGVMWLATSEKIWLPNPLNKAVFCFACAVLICGMASPWSDASLDTVAKFFKMSVFYFFLITTVRKPEDLKKLIGALLCIMVLYMAHSLREFIFNNRHSFQMGIRRLIGV